VLAHFCWRHRLFPGTTNMGNVGQGYKTNSHSRKQIFYIKYWHSRNYYTWLAGNGPAMLVPCLRSFWCQSCPFLLPHRTVRASFWLVVQRSGAATKCNAVTMCDAATMQDAARLHDSGPEHNTYTMPVHIRKYCCRLWYPLHNQTSLREWMINKLY